MTSPWLPNRLKKGMGHTSNMPANRAVMETAIQMDTPITRLMAPMSCLPQYWLSKTVAPLCTPKINSCTT